MKFTKERYLFKPFNENLRSVSWITTFGSKSKMRTYLCAHLILLHSILNIILLRLFSEKDIFVKLDIIFLHLDILTLFSRNFATISVYVHQQCVQIKNYMINKNTSM